MNTQKIWDYIYLNFIYDLLEDEQRWWFEDFKGFIENLNYE